MENKNSYKRYLISGLIGLIGLVGSYIPALLMVLPAFLAYVGAAYGQLCFALSSLVAAGSLYVLLDPIEASYMLLLIFPAALVLWYGFKRRISYRAMVALDSAALGIGYYLYICLPSILAGRDAFYEIEALIKSYADTMGEMAAYLGESAANAEAMSALFNSAVAFAPEMTILMTVLSAMCFGFFDVIIARLLLKKADGVVLREMSPFRDWQLSRSFTIGTLVLVIGALLLSFTELKNSTALMLAVDCIFTLPIMLMGACLVEFLIRAGRRNIGLKRTLFIAAFVVFLPYSVAVLFTIGIVDRLFRIRKRFRIKQL